MRIVHVPFCWSPAATGGTEVYVGALAKELCAIGLDAAIVAPRDSSLPAHLKDSAVPTFSVPAPVLTDDAHGDGDDALVDAFWQAAGPEQVDVLHLHAHTRAVSARLARSARLRGARVVATFHSPTFSCLAGRLLRYGRTPCTGVLGAEPCAACTVASKGVSLPLAKAFTAAASLIPATVVDMLPRRLATAAALPRHAQRRAESLAAFDTSVDAWVAPSEWVVDVLRGNGIASSRIVVSRQGVSWRRSQSTSARAESGPLRLAFVGRSAPEKGIDVLCSALAQLPAGTATLNCFVPEAPPVFPPGVRAVSGVHAEALLEQLAQHDLLCVPSQWMETGPLVVLEAFEAGTPVLGSALGGIAEPVRHDVDGQLVSRWWSASAWAEAIAALAADRTWLATLRAGVQPPRGMDEAAAEMAALYRRLRADKPSRSPGVLR